MIVGLVFIEIRQLSDHQFLRRRGGLLDVYAGRDVAEAGFRDTRRNPDTLYGVDIKHAFIIVGYAVDAIIISHLNL